MTDKLASYIEKRRQSLGMSQTEVSRRTKRRLSHTTIANLEKGIDPRTGKPRQPRVETLKILAPALDTTYDELAERAGYIMREQAAGYNVRSELDGLPLTGTEKEVVRALRKANDLSGRTTTKSR